MTRVQIDRTRIADDRVELSGGGARHLVQVLRIRVGESLVAFDGEGTEWPARVVEARKNRVLLELGPARQVSRESPLPLLLGVGIPKGDKLDTLIRMTTELGVRTIQPLNTARAVPDRVSTAKLERWRRIAAESCKQCGRNTAPEVAEPIALDEWVQAATATRKLVCWEGGGTPLSEITRGAAGETATTAVLIGPEGGLTPEEVARAEAAGFQRVSLGPRILKVDTAAAAVAAALQLVFGDF